MVEPFSAILLVVAVSFFSYKAGYKAAIKDIYLGFGRRKK